MEMVLQFVCARYPQYFSVVDKRILQNRILGTECDIESKHPLEILLENIPEDFGIMLRDDKTGFYVLRAGVICSALGWNLGTKIGLQLHQIHEPIPDYKEKMQFSMDRYVPHNPFSRYTNRCGIASSPRCQPTSPFNVGPGALKSENRYSCLLVIRMSSTGYHKTPTSLWKIVIFALTGRHSVDFLSLQQLFSTSRQFLRLLPSSVTNQAFQLWWPKFWEKGRRTWWNIRIRGMLSMSCFRTWKNGLRSRRTTDLLLRTGKCLPWMIVRISRVGRTSGIASRGFNVWITQVFDVLAVWICTVFWVLHLLSWRSLFIQLYWCVPIYLTIIK